MKIGTVEISGFAGLAPMAGVSDYAFRSICKEFGCGLLVTEMVSAKALTMNSWKTENILTFQEKERPLAIQIFGEVPEIMAEAAQICETYQPDFIDINMGCPAPKITGPGGGSALMRTPKLAGEIVRAVSDAVKVPVTVKIRKGWDEKSANAVGMARILEANGAAALTIHGRTREQMYRDTADWDMIREVKNTVRIPVIANGDVIDGKSAKALYEHTGADFIAVGRGACGAPYIFEEINHYMETGILLPEKTLAEKMGIMRKHIRLLCESKGEHIGMKEARTHCGWYLKGIPGAAAYRRALCQISTYDDMEEILVRICEGQESLC